MSVYLKEERTLEPRSRGGMRGWTGGASLSLLPGCLLEKREGGDLING